MRAGGKIAAMPTSTRETWQRRPWPLLAGLLLAAVLPAQAPAPATAARFTIVDHGCGDGAVTAANFTLHRLWTVAETHLPLPDEWQPRPVHLHRQVADYEAAEKARTGGRFAANLAFTSWDPPESHVVLQPMVDDLALQRIGLPRQTRLLLLHEASHLLVYAALPNHRHHPSWLSEGLACWLEALAAHDLGWLPDAMQEPRAATSLAMVAELSSAGRLPAFADLVQDRGLPEERPRRYALWEQSWAFLQREHPAALARFLQQVRAMPAGRELPQRLPAALEKALGGHWQGIDQAFATWLRRQEPQWFEAYRSLDTQSLPWVQCAFGDHNAVCWRRGITLPRDYDVQARFEVLSRLGDGEPQMNVLLDGRPEGFVAVQVVAGIGVTVQRFHAAKPDAAARWEVLGRARADVVPGRPGELRVRVRGPRLTIALDGTELLELDCGAELRAPWGLGVQAGTAGLWHAFAVTPAGG